MEGTLKEAYDRGIKGRRPMSMASSSRLGVEKGRCTQVRDIFKDRMGKKFEEKEGQWLVLRFWLGSLKL